MTGGTTPHGLRYPGGDDPLFNVPAYLQNLAEDIDRKVQDAGGDTTKKFANYTLATTHTVGSPWTSVPVPDIRWVRGGIIGQQLWSAGVVQRPVLLRISPIWRSYETWNQTYWNMTYIGALDPTIMTNAGGGNSYPQNFAGKVGLSLLLWGDPNPVGE